MPAIACYRREDAVLAYGAARELGLHAPRDVRIVIFESDGYYQGKLMNAMQPIWLPERRLGRAGAETLIRKIERPNRPCRPVAVKYDAAADFAAFDK